MSKYEFTEDMHEISGFGGGYEECCRRMLIAGIEWLDAHPNADPKFHGYKGIYGVITEDNADAKELSQAVIKATGDYGATGAMHQAVIGAAMYIKANGWEAYVKEMTHPDGKAGLLKEKLEDAQKSNKWLQERLEEVTAEKDRRGVIIAEKVLGWKKHKTDNKVQEAYGENPESVLSGIGLGGSLHQLIDDAIAKMEVAA